MKPAATRLTLRVRVVDESGAPVAGATARGDEASVATTDDDGTATIGGTKTGYASVTVTHPMPAEAQLSFSLGECSCGLVERTVTVRRGAPLGGTVFAPDGSPIAEADVEVWCEDGRSLFLQSDAHGARLTPAMQAGLYEVCAAAIGASLAEVDRAVAHVVLRWAERPKAPSDAWAARHVELAQRAYNLAISPRHRRTTSHAAAARGSHDVPRRPR